jgi:hypothetical protein
MPRPKVAVIAGYFDWFSGYQETALVGALAEIADVEVIAGDRVSTMFSETHLRSVGMTRTYGACLRSPERGVLMTRLPVRELRSMVWSWRARKVLSSAAYDLIVQVMPGQLLPFAATLWGPQDCVRVALYGDNSAMWSALSGWKQRLKWWVFSGTKGLLYRAVNRRARKIYNYTPETLRRLSAFQPSTKAELMPLTYRSEDFYSSDQLRGEWRSRLGFSPSDVVVATAGKMAAYKELERLLRAFRTAAQEEPALRLALAGAGDDSYSQHLRRLVDDDRVLRARTSFMGFLDTESLNGFLNAADIGVWPKLPAVTIQQAMGTGLFVVLPRNDWVGHLVTDDAVGYYVKPDDGEAELVTALVRAARDVPMDQTARRARSRANEWFSAAGVASALLADNVPSSVR